MKWIRYWLWAFVLVIGAALLLAPILRWFAVSDEARADVAMLKAPPPPVAGAGGYAKLALMDFDIPPGELDEAMATDIARFRAFERINREALLDAARSSPAGVADGSLPYVALEDSGYARRNGIDAAATTCAWASGDCLAQVRENHDQVRTALAQAADRVELAYQALSSAHLRSPYPNSYAAPLPPYQNLRLVLTDAALLAVEGRVPEAMSRTCGILADARRHHAGSHDLIGKAIMAVLTNGSANLLLQIRRASPDTLLPADCDAALAPVQAEDYLACDALRGEFRMASRVAHELDAAAAEKRSPANLFVRFAMLDADVQDAWIAPRFADACSDAYRTQVLAGTVPATSTDPIGMSNPTCWGAVLSCIVAGIAPPEYGRFQRRFLDSAAKLRLQLAALAVVDGRLSRDGAAAAAASPGYRVEASADLDELRVALQYVAPGQDPDFSVEL